MSPSFPIRPAKVFKPAHPYYVVHPGCSSERGMIEKRLPVATYAEIIRRIKDEFGMTAALIGGQEEKPLRDEIYRLIPGAVTFPETKSLAEVAGWIDGSEFFIGNDSGLMHVASSLGKPCIAFFGPTDDKRNGPMGDGHLIVRSDIPCSPCQTAETVGNRVPCRVGGVQCLRDIEVDEVWKTIIEFITRLRASNPRAGN